MAFTINTNIASLQSQEYLRISAEFQQKTISRVTSGLRIISSGDDAAGLAIANSFRSDRAVLLQGVRNANDGLSTLQTIDGGINNISLLLDRARTLATQSASGTFTGDRAVLNSEFQSVIEEIDRQAQSIGLDTNGQFAKNMSVFIGGGRLHEGEDASVAITNGSIQVDLTNSTVDARSLGLRGYQASGSADLTAAATSVEDIKVANGNTAIFNFYGTGFATRGAAGDVAVSVSLANVVDSSGLVEAINAAIEAMVPATAADQAFADAGIRAALSADGKNLTFQASGTSFQVEAGNNAAGALLGFFGASPTGSTTGARLEAAGVQQTATMDWVNMTTTADTQTLTVTAKDANGALHSLTINLDHADATLDDDGNDTVTLDEALNYINDQLQNSGNPTLADVAAVSRLDGGGDKLAFISSNPSFTVNVGEGSAARGVNSGSTTSATSASNGTGAAADIGTQASAEAAVSALAVAVSRLGGSQAVVGKGQNRFNYAISLAQTQISNIAASESRVRDADLAAEASNMTKAQILQQSGIAALAQANVAPQALLSLLQG
jgi:flagellin